MGIWKGSGIRGKGREVHNLEACRAFNRASTVSYQLPLEMSEHALGEGIGDGVPEDKMADLISRLHLTSEESDVPEVADDVEEGLATLDCAIIGKVLSHGVLHIQTIMVALRVAWGNPKGLLLKTVVYSRVAQSRTKSFGWFPMDYW